MVGHLHDAQEASTVFSDVNSCNKGVCVSSIENTDPQYREVKGRNVSRVSQTKKYYTKCFYNSNVDKKRVNGLLVKGNKAKNLVSGGVKIPTKIYYANKRGASESVITDPLCDSLCEVSNDIRTCVPLHTSGGDNSEVLSEVDMEFALVNHGENTSKCDISQDNGTGGSLLHSTCGTIVDTQTYYTENDKEIQAQNGVNVVSDDAMVKVFDINNANDDKYLNTLLSKQVIKKIQSNEYAQCEAFKKWRYQTDFDFGFVPLSDFTLPRCDTSGPGFESPIDQHFMAKRQGVPNFLGSRIPVSSQLNVDTWREFLLDYWDVQLIELLRYGFPLDFNRNCPLSSDKRNHSSAVQFPTHVETYLAEEKKFGAILGPFVENPIKNCHYSPFMTREKSGSENRRVIIDLSWPKNQSVNAGIDKNSYLNTEFALTFPTVDHVTQELKKLGRGAHLFKIDISRAFRHIKVDPADYDLLGLYWNGHFLDTCVPFGSRHGTQIFQRVSDAVRYVVRRHGYKIMNYVDDFFGVGTPRHARDAFDCLYTVLNALGLSISKKKLVRPGTQAICLGVLIDSEKGTISIPEEKMRQIIDLVNSWGVKKSCTKRQLQSLLGHLLYLHKCVKPARYFVNRMLDLLRSNYNEQTIKITADFQRDLRWFQKFLQAYNGVSIYDHVLSVETLELDACLTGLGARWADFVYQLPVPKNYQNMGIVHMEMVNIVVALKVFGPMWAGKRILVKCDNEAVVHVLSAGRTKDPFLGACARNVWYLAAQHDIEVSYTHVLGKNNQIADLLSRWSGSPACFRQLYQYVQNPVWIPVGIHLLDIDYVI